MCNNCGVNPKHGRSGLCKPCKSEYNKKWYLENKSKHQSDVAKNKQHYLERLRILKQVPCADCLGEFRYWQMDFDHLPQYEKEFELSRGAFYSLERVLAEVDKCEVVCKNCHADRTHHRWAHNAVVRPTTQADIAASLYSFPCVHDWCGVS